MSSGHVYFIRPVGMTGPTKIGFSIAPERRLMALSVWSPYPLEVAAKTPGSHRLERQFHNLLADHWTHHEWFRDDQQVTAVVEEVARGVFDFSRLDQTESLLREKHPRNLSDRTRRAMGLQIRLHWVGHAAGLQVPEAVAQAGRAISSLEGEAFEAAASLITAYADDPLANGGKIGPYPWSREKFEAFAKRRYGAARKAA